MSFQFIIATTAAVLAALYFIRGVVQDLKRGADPMSGSCGKCASGGCPAASKG